MAEERTWAFTRIFRRGQINAIDFLAAMIFFIFILVSFISLIDIQQKNNLVKLRQDRLLAAGTTIGDMLVESGGVPENWETMGASSIQAIGLAASQNNLSALKVNKFLATDYNTTKTLMGLPAVVDYHFMITNASGSVLYQSGINSSNYNISFLFTRYVIWNGSAAWMRLRLYE